MKISFEWETIVNGESYRAKVFGGWILESRILDDYGIVTHINSTFIPDPNHEWEVA